MRLEKLAAGLLMAGILPGLLWEGWRGLAAGCLHRGDFALLERLGPEIYFLPAVRAYACRRERSSIDPMMSWATRRLSDVVPGYDVYDLKIHSSGLLIGALNRRSAPDDDPRRRRLAAFDPDSGMSLVADTGPLEFGSVSGLELQLADVDGDGAEEILLITFGSGCTGRLFRLCSGRFEQIPGDGVDGNFCSGFGFEFKDVDGDALPELLGWERGWRNCPACGEEAQADPVTWFLHQGRWCQRALRCGACGAEEEGPWPD